MEKRRDLYEVEHEHTRSTSPQLLQLFSFKTHKRYTINLIQGSKLKEQNYSQAYTQWGRGKPTKEKQKCGYKRKTKDKSRPKSFASRNSFDVGITKVPIKDSRLEPLKLDSWSAVLGTDVIARGQRSRFLEPLCRRHSHSLCGIGRAELFLRTHSFLVLPSLSLCTARSCFCMKVRKKNSGFRLWSQMMTVEEVIDEKRKPTFHYSGRLRAPAICDW